MLTNGIAGAQSARSWWAGAALAVVLGSTSTVSAAAKLDDYAGYWTGTGKVSMTNGSTEQVKCVVTYKVTGQELRQNVRCAGQGFSFNGTAQLQVAQSGSVTGSWTENTYAATGDVTGKTTDKGLLLSISGQTFTAVMDVSTSACKQTMDIVPKGLEVSRISIGLGKC